MFKRCIYLTATRTGTIAYCLKYREWINTCPAKCGYCEAGTTGTMEEVREKKFNMECKRFTRVKTKEGEVKYFCTLYLQEAPFCEKCLFAEID